MHASARVVSRERAGLPALIRALRFHQWLKNILLFVAPLGAHRLEPRILAASMLAFVAFGLVASSGYVLNDLLDLESDRRHETKRLRPFAAGLLSPARGVVLVALLLALGMALAFLVPVGFGLLVAGYWLVTLAYSLGLKRLPVLDVMILAALYTSRIFAGSLAVQVPVSQWLFTFSLFFFLSLAFLKRASELARAGAELPGRGYGATDREQIFNLGAASGYLSVLVLALYVSSHEVTRLYSHAERLWLLCPLLLYWVSRIWLEARRGNVDDDPVLFAMKDWTSRIVGALGALTVLLSI